MENDRSEIDIQWMDMNVVSERLEGSDGASRGVVWHSGPNDKYGLKSELLLHCSPDRFMDPYDVVRVRRAINIYKMLQHVSCDNIKSLSALRKKAEVELAVKLDVDCFYRHLMKIYSPVAFVEDYNPKLMDRYHDICVLLTNSKEDMDGLERVVRTIMSEDDKEAQETKAKEVKERWKCIMWLVLFFLLLLLLYNIRW